MLSGLFSMSQTKTHIWSLCTNTFRMVVSLSIKLVFCISPTIFVHKSFFPKDLLNFMYHSLYASTKFTDYEWYYNDLIPDSFFLNFVRFSFPLISMLFSCGHITNPYGFFSPGFQVLSMVFSTLLSFVNYYYYCSVLSNRGVSQAAKPCA